MRVKKVMCVTINSLVRTNLSGGSFHPRGDEIVPVPAKNREYLKYSCADCPQAEPEKISKNNPQMGGAVRFRSIVPFYLITNLLSDSTFHEFMQELRFCSKVLASHFHSFIVYFDALIDSKFWDHVFILSLGISMSSLISFKYNFSVIAISASSSKVKDFQVGWSQMILLKKIFSP